jgi:ubiquinone/menaquinone biosynthesis C-methylase UbiE
VRLPYNNARMQDDFARFEHTGWERVANKYDSVWSSLTRQFIPHLVSDADVSAGLAVLDVACGPGYLSDYVRKLGANPTGVDFSDNMVAIAKEMFPGISFLCGDAQNLPCENDSFDRVLINFGLLHVSRPEQACAEAARVLRSSGKFGFTVWARPTENPGAKIVNDAIETHADLDVDLPEGPPHYLYGDKQGYRKVLEQAGFDGESMSFQTRLVEWALPNASFLFEAERDAGVRTAGLLARQSPERLNAIRRAIEEGIKHYAKDDRFLVPFAAHVVVVSK